MNFIYKELCLVKPIVLQSKDKSIYSTKIEQDSKFSDLFGINAELSSKIYGFGFDSEIGLNSLDINKFNNILTSKNIYQRSFLKKKKRIFQNLLY